MTTEKHNTDIQCEYLPATGVFEVVISCPGMGMHERGTVPAGRFKSFAMECLADCANNPLLSPGTVAMLSEVLDGAWRQYQDLNSRN